MENKDCFNQATIIMSCGLKYKANKIKIHEVA